MIQMLRPVSITRAFNHSINQTHKRCLNLHPFRKQSNNPSANQSSNPSKGQPPILFLIGGPGAGKGTQSKLLIDEFGAHVRGPSDGTVIDPSVDQTIKKMFPTNQSNNQSINQSIDRSISNNWGLIHLSIGALLRREMTSSSIDQSNNQSNNQSIDQSAKSQTIKRAITEAIQSGVILPGEITVVLIEQEINRLMAQQQSINQSNNQTIKPCFVIDGFPRSMDNVQEFESNLGHMHSMLCLKVDDSILRSRLAKRSGSPSNNQSINPSNNQSINQSNVRTDDSQAIVEKRIKTFHTVTEPVIEMWKHQSNNQTNNQTNKQYFEADGEPDIPTVYKTVRQVYLDWILNHPQNKTN